MRRIGGMLLAGFFMACANAQPTMPAMPEFEPDLPITIDAESSEFDYATSRLVFRGLRMVQGNLGIRADLAETDKLDFTNGLWIFTGNVVLEADTAKLYCDKARISFVNHELTAAELTGQPARFEQSVAETGATNTGRARSIIFKQADNSLKLNKDAHFSDGSNEISGDLITYDLVGRRLTAGSGDSGPVKILIEPPSQLKEKNQRP